AMTTAFPTTQPALTADQLTVIVASMSCMVFFVIILVLLTILYRKDPLCCKVRSYQNTHPHPDAPPQYHSSRQTLVRSSYGEQSPDMAFDNLDAQPGQLYFIGPPSSYQLPHLEAPLPRLPSYESVRKKDRQRQIHMMIAHRFGLSTPAMAEVSYG
uniref:Si:ch73-364h19.1 n=1 Tax=Lepisosteus oculatus TaxID=7918 RepID=W5MZ33_LEPOC